MIRIQALGGLTVHGDDGRPRAGAAAQPRRMAVLAMLVHAGERGVPRDRLLAMLWPDVEEERARNNLAQALYALRRDLGDETIVGTKDLRLDLDHVSTDVAEFRAAIARNDKARAVALYSGPFVDGLHVPGSADLERWIDDERRHLDHEYRRILEALARESTTLGDTTGAVTQWRRLAAADPLNARVAIGLMEALVAAGDRVGAIDHARIYEALLAQELDLPLDRDVLRLAQRLREEAASAPSRARVASPMVEQVSDVASVKAGYPTTLDPEPRATAATAATGAPPNAVHRRAGSQTRLVASVFGALSVFAVVGYLALKSRERMPSTPVVAVGRIATYDLGDRSAELTAPLGDLLATNLARVPGMRVISAGRMLELMARFSADSIGQASAGMVTRAARLAGANELVDGTLYGRPGGRFRLDLRRVDVSTGSIVDVRTVEGPDVFSLVDSGTAQLAVRLGASAPAGSVADVTTRSLAAYRLYLEGLKRHYALDDIGAYRLFGEAVAEDSTFAMATYYWALKTPNAALVSERMERAMRLSAAASDRERLTIHAGWALQFSVPELAAIADTLATRYPDEVEGYLYRGAALVMAQEYLAAVPYLRRAVQMDSVAGVGGKTATGGACAACDARGNLFFAYDAADSLAAAGREVKAWREAIPTSASAWIQQSVLLDQLGRPNEALAALDSARRLETGGSTEVQNALALHWIFIGDYPRVEELERARLATGATADQHQALWYLAIALRDQGRMTEALEMARRYRVAEAANETQPIRGAAHQSALMEAVVLDAAARYDNAAALFDSLSRWRVPGLAPSQFARNRVWMSAHEANARAAALDTSRLAQLAESVSTYGAQSAYGRDQRLYHHVRGLIFAARGENAAAADEYRASIRSINRGYTRTNLALARALVSLGKPSDAVTMLQAALRGDVEGPGLYASRTELHDWLARAWDLVGRRDSAAVHYEFVARVWRTGDPPFRARASQAAARASEIAGR